MYLDHIKEKVKYWGFPARYTPGNNWGTRPASVSSHPISWRLWRLWSFYQRKQPASSQRSARSSFSSHDPMYVDVRQHSAGQKGWLRRIHNHISYGCTLEFSITDEYSNCFLVVSDNVANRRRSSVQIESFRLCLVTVPRLSRRFWCLPI